MKDYVVLKIEFVDKQIRLNVFHVKRIFSFMKDNVFYVLKIVEDANKQIRLNVFHVKIYFIYMKDNVFLFQVLR